MRICVLVDPRGDSRRADREADALTAAGHQVTLVPLRRMRHLTVRGVRECEPQVIHAHGPGTLSAALRSRRVASAHLVYDSDAPITEHRWMGPLRRARAKRRERRALEQCDAVVASSAAAADRFQRAYSLETSPVVVRNLAETLEPLGPPARLRARLRVGPAPLVLLDGDGVSRTHCENVIRALAEVEDVRLAVLGADSWDYRDALELLADRVRVGDRVHLLKAVPDGRLPSYAADADIAVVLASSNGARLARPLPPCVFSYVAAGTPILAGGSLDLSELVAEHGIGWTVDPEDPIDIAEALARGCHAERSQRRANVLRAGSALTWTEAGERLAGLYDRLPMPRPSRSRERLGLLWLRRARALLADLRASGSRRGWRRPRAFVLYVWGRNLRSSGAYERAAAALSRATARDPDDPRYALHLAMALKDAGRVGEAERAFRAVLDAQGGRPNGLAVNAGINLARLGVKAEGEALLAALGRSRADNAGLVVRTAELQVALGHVGAARDSAARALDLAPTDSSLQLKIARVLEQAGEPSRALELAESLGAQTVARRLTGTIRTLDETWLPAIPSAPSGYRPRRGRVLNLLETSLPHATAGYAYRSAAVLGAQIAAGLEPLAATRVGFPATRGVHGYSLVESVGNVVHHRFPLPGVTRVTSIPADELLRRNARMLFQVVRSSRPAAIQAATPHLNGLLGLSLSKEFGIPFVYDVRGFPEMTWAVRRGGDDTEVYLRRRASETRCMRDADAVVTLSDVMRESIVERGLPAERVHVVPHAVDTDALTPRARDAELGRGYGLEGKFVVGYIGSMLEYEGIDVLLRAVALARNENPRVCALVVGDGAAATGLRQLATDLGLGGDAVFAGRIPSPAIADHYALLDLFVCPRRDLEVCRLVTPLKPFEAMAMARCVAVSDLPALTEPLLGGANGRSFKAGDEEELAALVCELADDPEQVAALASRAREFVITRHSPAAAADALRSVYAGLGVPGDE